MAWLTFIAGRGLLSLALIQSVQGLINNIAWAVFFWDFTFHFGCVGAVCSMECV